MSDTPKGLQEICLEKICTNLSDVFEVYYENEDKTKMVSVVKDEMTKIVSKKYTVLHKRYRFKDDDLFLFNELSDSLFLKLEEKRLLSDSTLSLFSAKNTKLKNIKIKDSEDISYNGLKILKQHKIKSLECIGVLGTSVDKILDCLGEWSLCNITHLNISRCSFIDSSRHCMMVGLTQLKNLQNLDVSYTQFNQECLKLICEDLKGLEKLNISGTFLYDLTPLLKFTDQLTSLRIADFRLSKQMSSVIVCLNTLRHLDVSLTKDPLDMYDVNTVLEIFKYRESLPHLVSLDISGWRNFISNEIFDAFLQSHRKLRYVGLILNPIVFEPHFSEPADPNFNKNLVIAGVANDSQIKVTLTRYYECPIFVQRALYHLFRLSSMFQEPRPDILEALLPSMELHSSNFGVQMAATACIYNLTRGEFSKGIHPKFLKTAVELILNAMSEFPDEYQLQQNSLLTLCSDRILQDVSFDRFRCAKLVLDSLCIFEESNINRMAVAICSILAAKVSTDETSELGARPGYMQKLLSIVENRTTRQMSDVTLKFTLSALWNLTDESAVTCTVFLNHGGACLFLNVLTTFRFDTTIETKVLGLLNNIAEVEKLRGSLMTTSLIAELYELLKSELIDVSYFAAGIVAHLASDGDHHWYVENYSRKQMLEALSYAISNWKVPDSEMVAYRSFKPFLPLMRSEMDYPVQLWAVWAIHHVCTKNPARYCHMLRIENGVEYLTDLRDGSETHEHIKNLSEQILQLLESQF